MGFGATLTVEYSLEGRGLPPYRKHRGDAGWDLHAMEDTPCMPGKLNVVRTGVRIAAPHGMWFYLVGRSSSLIRGIEVVPAIIDNGFRGELLVHAKVGRAQVIVAEQRLAQIIPMIQLSVEWQHAIELPEGDRGDAGFGSTGT